MGVALVLGAGMVGTFAARAIAEAGHRVVAADRAPARAYYERYGPATESPLVAVDILQAGPLETLMRACRAEVVVLATRVASETGAEESSALGEQVHGARIVAESARRAGVRRLVFVSSFAVYGQPAVRRLREALPAQPITPYGRAKAAAEAVLATFDTRGLDLRILRPCGIFGPQRPGHASHSCRLIDRLLVRALLFREFAVRAPRASLDEFLYVRDLGRAIALASVTNVVTKPSVYNVGPGRRTTVGQLCQALEAAVPGTRVTVEVRGDADSQPVPPLEVGRIKRCLGFVPRYDLAAALADYLEAVGLSPSGRMVAPVGDGGAAATLVSGTAIR